MRYGTKTLTKIVKQLKQTRDLLDVQGAWTKGVFARNAVGKQVPVGSPDACSHCIAGAMRVVTGATSCNIAGKPLFRYVASMFAPESVGMWSQYSVIPDLNDKRSTTHEQVMFALDFTLAQAKDELKTRLKK